jgi:hypothetical protein
MANTTINKMAMLIVNSVPVKSAANGKIDRPVTPSEKKARIGEYKIH